MRESPESVSRAEDPSESPEMSPPAAPIESELRSEVYVAPAPASDCRASAPPAASAKPASGEASAAEL